MRRAQKKRKYFNQVNVVHATLQDILINVVTSVMWRYSTDQMFFEFLVFDENLFYLFIRSSKLVI